MSSDRIKTGSLIALTAAALGLAAASRSQAQVTSHTDARWMAWIGCWAATQGASIDGTLSAPLPGVTCIVPITGSRAVEALTIARGTVVARDRLDGSGRPHPIEGQGCTGTENVNWAATGRRVYLYAAYTCAGDMPGTSATMFAFSADGEWLRIEKIRSGNGAIMRIDRLRPTAISPSLSADVATAIQRQQRAVATARAAAASAITSVEIVDAVHNLDGDVVRSWLIASGQTFDFDAPQALAMANAGVPVPLLQLVAPSLRTQAVSISVDAPAVATVYTNAVEYVEPRPQMTTMRVCPPPGCYPTSPYSDYNGYGYNPYGYNPGIVNPYGYLPFISPAPFIVTNGGNVRGGSNGKRGNGSGFKGDGGRDGRGHSGPRPPQHPGGRSGQPVAAPTPRPVSGRGR